MAKQQETPASGPGSNESNSPTGEARKVSSGNRAQPCTVCGQDLSLIRLNVEGNILVMESCDGCDVRRWQLEGERIDLQKALEAVAEKAGRRS